MRGDVDDHVAELVGLQHHRFPDIRRAGLWPRCSKTHEVGDDVAEFLGIHAFAQVSRHRRKDVAPVEGIAHRRMEIVFGSDVAHGHSVFPFVHQGEHAIVRSDEIILSRSHQDGPAGASNARIDNHQVNGIFGKIGVSLGNGQGPIQNVE